MPILLVLGTLTYHKRVLVHCEYCITNSKSLHFTCLESGALLTPSREILIEAKTEESEEASSYLKSNLVQPVLCH